MMKFILVLILTLQEPHSFTDFGVDCLDGFPRVEKPSSDDLSDKEIEAIKSQWNMSSKQFSCNHVIISWGCGTGCQSHSVYNMQSGLRIGSFTSSYGIEFERYSSLIKVNADPIHKKASLYYNLNNNELIKLD